MQKEIEESRNAGCATLSLRQSYVQGASQLTMGRHDGSDGL